MPGDHFPLSSEVWHILYAVDAIAKIFNSCSRHMSASWTFQIYMDCIATMCVCISEIIMYMQRQCESVTNYHLLIATKQLAPALHMPPTPLKILLLTPVGTKSGTIGQTSRWQNWGLSTANKERFVINLSVGAWLQRACNHQAKWCYASSAIIRTNGVVHQKLHCF